MPGVPSRKIALGLEAYLDDFARTNRAESWKQFTEDPMEWKAHFLRVMGDARTEILFNLEGVDVWKGITRASRGAGGATDWELLQENTLDLFESSLEYFAGTDPTRDLGTVLAQSKELAAGVSDRSDGLEEGATGLRPPEPSSSA